MQLYFLQPCKVDLARRVRKKNVGNVKGIRNWNFLEERMLVMDALLIGKSERVIARKSPGRSTTVNRERK